MPRSDCHFDSTDGRDTRLRDMVMKCSVPNCGEGMHTGTNLYRINEKGKSGVWVCQKHRHLAPPDKDLDKFVKVVNNG